MEPVPDRRTVIDNKEAGWDNSKRKDELWGKDTPTLKVKELCLSRRKCKVAFLIVLKSSARD